MPIHVWTPAEVADIPDAKVALAPLAGDQELAKRVQEELLAQRPVAKADVALFTAEQLAQKSPIRLASTAELASDLTALKAAEVVGAELLLQGEIVSARLEPPSAEPLPPEQVNMNQAFFQKTKKEEKNESLLLSWRVIETETGATLGSRVYNLSTQDAKETYPDLVAKYQDETDLLIAASAREAWKSLSPYVVKDTVRLAKPYLQLGAWGVRRGIKAAKKGQWELAEQRWSRVAKWFPFNASAQHNLAIALAAREDFPGAKEQLLRAKGPLAFRLPGETLFWIDQRHRDYNSAHHIPKPISGWAFPEPDPEQPLVDATPMDLEDLPWWSAIPFTKPPGWTWQEWLRQPLVL